MKAHNKLTTGKEDTYSIITLVPLLMKRNFVIGGNNVLTVLKWSKP